MKEEIMEILKDINPDVDYESEDGLMDDEILDSFDIATLVSNVSEEFDVTIPTKDITPENFNSAEALSALIGRLEKEEEE